MDGFKFVSKNECIEFKNKINELISYIQKDIKSYFTFSFKYVGPCQRNMVTFNEAKYIGYDFNIRFNINDNERSADEIKNIFIKSINNYLRVNGNDELIDDINGIRILFKDDNYLVLKHTLDIEIVRKNDNGDIQYIKKKNNNYIWCKETIGNLSLDDKYDLLIECGLKDFIKYQYLKRRNNEPNKKSIIIFEECIAAIYHEFYDNERSFL